MPRSTPKKALPKKAAAPKPTRKKPGPKPRVKPPVSPASAEEPRAVKRTPRAKAPSRSERLERSLLPGVTPEIVVPKRNGGSKTFKHIEVSKEQAEQYGFAVTIDPTMFQRTKRATGKVPLPVSFDPRLYSAITRYNPRRGGVSSFCNQSVARWLRDNIDAVLLASLEAGVSRGGNHRTSVVSIDPDMATKLKAAVVVLKDGGFTKATIQGLILGCALLQARDLRLV